ncbi:glycosyltransferase family 4 protein [Parvularcula sp. IMCC14364]|uniref:glycosyltransferase family 4 protein n=1 Tax=Parvularcula sp. IMCC14364 TaxID=3067902 RepID=UPI0027425A80|nr:glycosyltransferase family 4 protein [Parvularcula sp. IMCC14364]
MSQAPILFFHSVDQDNLNAQSNNVKAILARWDASEIPATAFHFRAPDPLVAANSNVRLIKLPPNRLWKAKALAAGLNRYSGVVYPCLSAVLDDRFRQMRRALGLGGAVISTLEGVPADQRNQIIEQERLSELVGHKVFCQGIKTPDMAALSRVKADSDLLIAISPFLERIANTIWPDVKTADIPLGVNVERFHARDRVPHGSNKTLKVVSAGNVQQHKRPDVFFELARAHPEVEFMWYGEGKQRHQLQSRAASEGLFNLVLPGAVDGDSLAAAFRQADIFTLPSVSEGVPKVTQEAAACGLPVVCMQYYEPFSVRHGVNGYLAEDDTAYAEHIETLIKDAELRARMGAAGAEMAEDWNWAHVAKRWQTAIRDTVHRVAAGSSND